MNGIIKQVNIAMSEIERGAVEFIGRDYIEKLVTRFYTTGERFIVKAGFDPTAPDLHFGHTILIQKLATFQKFGGDVKFLIGDFTAQIGDPTDKSQTRKRLTREEVLENAKTYERQVFKILDSKNAQICFNSAWLDALGVEGLLELTASFSVARMLERDDFAKRYKNNQSISILEFIYPLLQGYDSVAINCDIELGGNDQKFNLLMGRSMQRAYGLEKEQSILTMPLLEGLDGVKKMSKSLNNYIAVDDEPNNMYSKIMSISDELSWRYYELLSSSSLEEIEILKRDVFSGALHPKVAKEMLALELTGRFCGSISAKEAKSNFDSVFSKNQIPKDLDTIEFHSSSSVWICKILVDVGFVPSTSAARREIRAGGVRINQSKVTDENFKLDHGDFTLSLGKRKFINIRLAQGNK